MDPYRAHPNQPYDGRYAAQYGQNSDPSDPGYVASDGRFYLYGYGPDMLNEPGSTYFEDGSVGTAYPDPRNDPTVGVPAPAEDWAARGYNVGPPPVPFNAAPAPAPSYGATPPAPSYGTPGPEPTPNYNPATQPVPGRSGPPPTNTAPALPPPPVPSVPGAPPPVPTMTSTPPTGSGTATGTGGPSQGAGVSGSAGVGSPTAYRPQSAHSQNLHGIIQQFRSNPDQTWLHGALTGLVNGASGQGIAGATAGGTVARTRPGGAPPTVGTPGMPSPMPSPMPSMLRRPSR